MFSDGYFGVFNTKRNRYVKPHTGDKNSPYFRYGLRTISNKSKTTYLHRLVGLAFIDGWDEDKEIDHVDCNPLNNLKSNLEWVTSQVNTQRAVVNGLGVGRRKSIKVKKEKLSLIQISQSGSKGKKGLTFDQVESVFMMYDNGFTETVIAEKFGVTQPCISQIIKGKRWKEHLARLLYMSKLESIS